MTPLRQRMREDMQLRGLSPATQESYLRAISCLARHYNTSPDQLTEDQLRQYFLYLRNEKRFARSTSTVALCAIKFLFIHTLHRPWPILEFVRAPKEHKLPVILSLDEVRLILSLVRTPHYHACLSIIYACGLRIHGGQGSLCPAPAVRPHPLADPLAHPSPSPLAGLPATPCRQTSPCCAPASGAPFISFAATVLASKPASAHVYTQPYLYYSSSMFLKGGTVSSRPSLPG